jgi:hypothetical protein
MMRWDSISQPIAEAMCQDGGIKLRFFISQGRNLNLKECQSSIIDGGQQFETGKRKTTIWQFGSSYRARTLKRYLSDFSLANK